MPPYNPIVLSGENLGLRHHHLNTLVSEAYKQGVSSFHEIKDLSESTPVDRLFKIDLASKLRNVDYILQNIKDEDMLYVSRALKAKWLVGQKYQDIINPEYLEENLYPYMITTAVSKLKNWLYLNLKEPLRCEGFYTYYSNKNFDYAMKFLGHCNNNFILFEASKILEKLTPYNFKILCEKCPQVAKVYFDNIPNNDQLKTKFLDSEEEFYKSLKVVLKLDADIFFGITEKYFDHKYSRSVTKHIMKVHKTRFDKKPELYAGMLLNMQTLAECLSSEECKELVLKLARATYISNNVDYKFVEPLIKRLPKNERAPFKKRVFVEKAVGELVETWPYEKPSLPNRTDYQNHVFEDRTYPHYEYNPWQLRCETKMLCTKNIFDCVVYKKRVSRSLLEKLFDEYRFMSFERTLFELRRRIKEESSSQNRQFMLLVLVSKSGGQPELVTSLLQLLEQHSNEPANVRAAVVRSLVKRAAVWRLPQPSWEAMLKFARGLGLDGKPPEAKCREGLDAVVIRSFLESGECDPAVRDAFLEEISFLDQYSTNNDERKVIRDKLPELLLAAVNAESSTRRQAELLTSLLQLLQTYNVNIESSRLIPALAALQKRDASAAEDLLLRLFEAKVARRKLFREIFPLIQTDASYLNALRHDTSVLNVSTFVDLIHREGTRPEQFLRKLATYFAEPSGMMQCYLNELKGRIGTNTTDSFVKSIARPLCLLQGACIDYLESLDVTTKDVARFAAAVRANMHAGRPKLNIDEKHLSTIGAKAIANKLLICPTVEVDKHIQKLLTWKRTIRVALVLAERTGKEADVYHTAALLRPMATLKAALKYFRRRSDFDPRVWEVFLKLMNNLDISTDTHLQLRNYMAKLDNIPCKIKPEYCEVLFKALIKDHFHDAIDILSYIEELLLDVKEDFLESILLDFLQKYNNKEDKVYDRSTRMQVRMLVKFLLLCKSEEVLAKRFKILGEPFLQFLTSHVNKPDKGFMDIFEEVLLTLQYNKVFFDETYISPLPVFENFITWMRRYLPVELNFNIYVLIHLTMLYCKSIRLGIKSYADIFSNEKKKLTDGLTVVGHIFGKYIAQEIKQLKESYFESAIDLYRVGVEDYFNNYFVYDVSKYKFIKAVVQGMLEGSVGDEARAALYLLQDQMGNLDSKDTKELFDTMKNVKNDKFKYFLFANYLYYDNILLKKLLVT